jgi:hypothetical protein
MTATYHGIWHECGTALMRRLGRRHGSSGEGRWDGTARGPIPSLEGSGATAFISAFCRSAASRLSVSEPWITSVHCPIGQTTGRRPAGSCMFAATCSVNATPSVTNNPVASRPEPAGRGSGCGSTSSLNALIGAGVRNHTAYVLRDSGNALVPLATRNVRRPACNDLNVRHFDHCSLFITY